MKKTIFTVFSVAALTVAILFACKKEDDTGTHKTNYSSLSGVGTGSNPNPNNNPSSTTGGVTTSSTGVSTSTTGTTSTTYGSINDGTSYTFTSSTSCSAAMWTGGTSGGSLILSFSAAPTSGTYTTVQTGATSGQVVVTWKGGNALNGGTVTVSASGSKYTATLTSVMWGTTTLTGSLTCM